MNDKQPFGETIWKPGEKRVLPMLAAFALVIIVMESMRLFKPFLFSVEVLGECC